MLDKSKLKTIAKEIKDRQNLDGIVTQRDIDEVMDFRIAPPTDSLEGSFALEAVIIWLDGKKFVSPKTFGEDCPIVDTVNEAKNSNDPELHAILESKNSKGMKKLQIKKEYWCPILVLELENEDEGVEGGFKIKDNEWKIFQFSSQIFTGITDQIIGRFAKKDPTDMEDGQPFFITKQGKGINTKYTVQITPEVYDMSEFKKLYDNIPDVYEMAQKMVKDKTTMQSAIDIFLYGEIQKAVEEEEEEEKQKAAPKRQMGDKKAQAKAPKKRRRSLLEVANDE